MINHSKSLIKKSKYYILLSLLVIIFFLINRKIFFIIIFTVIGCFIKYKKAMMRVPITIEPVFFFGILLTRTFGIEYALALIIPAVFGIDLVVGDITINTMISFIVQLGLNLVSLLFVSQNILIFGLIVSIINMVVSVLLSAFWGVPPDRMILMPLSGFLINIAYFMTLGELLEKLMVMI